MYVRRKQTLKKKSQVNKYDPYKILVSSVVMVTQIYV